MRKLIIGTVCLLWVTGGILLAQDGKGAQLEKIRTLRASLLIKLPPMNDLFDHEHNGINTAAAALQRQYLDASATVTKRIETEEVKPAAEQDKAVAEALRAKLTRFQALWTDRATVAGPIWTKKFNDLSATRQNLTTVVNDLTNVDQYWTRADCDLALFVAVLTELNKRVDDVKDQASALVTEWIKKTETDTHTLQE